MDEHHLVLMFTSKKILLHSGSNQQKHRNVIPEVKKFKLLNMESVFVAGWYFSYRKNTFSG